MDERKKCKNQIKCKCGKKGEPCRDNRKDVIKNTSTQKINSENQKSGGGKERVPKDKG
jgi:hypothetical protein